MPFSDTPKLFTPVLLGGTPPLRLQHRVVMAPLTRLRASTDGLQPQIAATYYQQRSTPGGLIIAEGSNISASARGFDHSPGLFTGAQIEAWRHVTAAVHENQGIMFAQLWHTGRVGHSDLQPNNDLPVSSTANHPDELFYTEFPGHSFAGPSRALLTEEIPGICMDFQQAAVNAMTAGFNGVELNASNGYLLEQFLYDEINDREDVYGGSIENRSRFMFEALEAILMKVDACRVGVRLSPFSMTCGQKMTHPMEDSMYMLQKLQTYNLAYVHIIEPRGFHGRSPLAPEECITPMLRKFFSGVLMTASGYGHQDSMQIVEDGHADLVAFGRPFVANPDLVERFRIGASLNSMDEMTLYNAGTKGYIDYPYMEQSPFVGQIA